MWLSVLVAAVVGFIFSAVWYTFLFGKTWARLMNFDPSGDAMAMKGGMAKPMVLNFILQLMSAFALFFLYPQVLALSYVEFLKIVLILWFGFSFPIYANSALWERKSWNLVYLNSIYGLLSFTLVSAVVYFMQ